ncbi:MAG TPA: universal stress protein [Pseudonocardiaceae bacterium]|nr:universal stress protein [Pseudonocardiaceae bacterium]
MTGTVVVGMDGSADSTAALRWALGYAGANDAVVHVVHVWTPLPWFGELAPYQQDRLAADRARSAEQAVARTAQALRTVDRLPAGVEASVVQGAPGATLVDLSRDALILVVGATGSGGAETEGSPRVGATARYVTRHASCPVTVIGRHRHPHTVDPIRLRTIPIPIPLPVG